MIKPLHFLPVLALLSCFGLYGQDPQFTQFYAAPLTINPALTGAFNGTYRLGVIYRDQWRQALENPNVSYAATVDMRFRIQSRRKRIRDAFGGGMVFYSDKFSGSGFSTNQLSVSSAFHKALDRDGNEFLSLGAQVGVAQRNIGYGNIVFDDQFNGSTGFDNPTQEDLPENNFSFGDFAVGLNYTRASSRGTAVFAGAALHHITEPQVSFFFNRGDENQESRGDNTLLQKISAHFAMQIPISGGVQVLPRALFFKQGPHMVLNAGANMRFLLNDISGIALHLGGAVRPVSNVNSSFAPESVIAITGLEISNFLIGFSYDANIRDFSASSNRRNVFEISIAYLGNYDNETVLCPKF